MKIFFTQFFSVFLPPLLQYYGYLMQRVDSLGKTLMLWGVGGRRRRGWQRMRWLDGITNSMDTSLSKFWELVMDREPWHATIHRVSKSQTWLSDHKNRIGHFTQTQPNIHFSNVKMKHLQFSSVTQSFLFVTAWTAACQASLSITSSQSQPKPMSIVSVMPSNHLILCHPFILLTSIFSSIRVFSNESALCIKWPRNWNFSFYFWLNYKSSLDLKSRLGKFKVIDISNIFFLNHNGMIYIPDFGGGDCKKHDYM